MDSGIWGVLIWRFRVQRVSLGLIFCLRGKEAYYIEHQSLSMESALSILDGESWQMAFSLELKKIGETDVLSIARWPEATTLYIKQSYLVVR